MSLVSKNALNWVKTIFSNNFERNGSFEISLKFERGINMDGSYAGSTIADLIHSTLFTKKERNWLHMSAEAFRVVAWGTFRIELMRDYDNFTQWFEKNISFSHFSLYSDKISNSKLLQFIGSVAQCHVILTKTCTFWSFKFQKAWFSVSSLAKDVSNQSLQPGCSS